MVHHRPTVINQITHRTQVITQHPGGLTIGLLRQYLINHRTIEIARTGRSACARKLQIDIASVVHKARRLCPYRLGEALIQGIVGVSRRPTHTIHYTRQTVPVIPGKGARTAIACAGLQIPFIVIGVVVGAIRRQLIIATRLIARVGAVPIRIIGIAFITDRAVVSTR